MLVFEFRLNHAVDIQRHMHTHMGKKADKNQRFLNGPIEKRVS